MAGAAENLLIYGDNLDVLRRHHREILDESVDLVYLDPPFNSNATYNVLFAEHGTSGPDPGRAAGHPPVDRRRRGARQPVPRGHRADGAGLRNPARVRRRVPGPRGHRREQPAPPCPPGRVRHQAKAVPVVTSCLDYPYAPADVECERRSPYTLSASDAQNAPFGAAPMVMGTACHNVPNGGYSLVTGTNGDHFG